MANLESNLNKLSETFDKLNEIRETSLTISRSIVRDCSKSIRFIHRNDINGAEEFIVGAKKKITELKKLTKNVSEISFAGYVLDAEREYVASLMSPVTTPVKVANYITPPTKGVHGNPVDFEYVRFN